MNAAEGVEVPLVGSDGERHMAGSGLVGMVWAMERWANLPSTMACTSSSPDISDGFIGYRPRPPGYDAATVWTSRDDGRLLRTMGSSRMKSTITVASRAQAPAA